MFREMKQAAMIFFGVGLGALVVVTGCRWGFPPNSASGLEGGLIVGALAHAAGLLSSLLATAFRIDCRVAQQGSSGFRDSIGRLGLAAADLCSHLDCMSPNKCAAGKGGIPSLYYSGPAWLGPAYTTTLSGSRVCTNSYDNTKETSRVPGSALARSSSCGAPSFSFVT